MISCCSYSCCWWGRGVIQTTGLCNYGKLNYFLGARAAAEGREAKYPDIDFCKTPDVICSSEEHSELKWIAGLYYWMKEVQEYNKGGWYYKTELHKFVNSGMKDTSFINAVSGIVNRGCHNPPCATGDVDGLHDRRSNFQEVLRAFKLLPRDGPRPSATKTLPPIPAPPGVLFSQTSSDPKLFNAFLHRLSSRRSVLEEKVLSYEATTMGEEDSVVYVQSDLYTFDTLMESVAYAYMVGHAGKRFYVGSITAADDQSTPDLRYGLVNMAAFLAQSQNEGIKGNACDEYHLDSIGGKYPISNSCGQFGNNYQDYECSHKGMQCPVETNMMATAVLSGKYADSPHDYRPNFYCGPDEEFTGAYDPDTMFDVMGPFANSQGRTDVKGCCFWGRGALLTKGTCMLGKLNHYLGKEAANSGRMAMFPDVDFCRNPEDICRHIERHPTIVWDIAFFEWVERIQEYDDGNFNYQLALQQFVDGGMQDPSFINIVSKIVAKGSARAEGTIPFSQQKLNHFNLLMEHLQLKDSTPLVTSDTSSGQRCIPKPATIGPHSSLVPQLFTVLFLGVPYLFTSL
mmetsp:Transcript_21053/g.45696  ORF Transcript_21053/g.45696 Transcript_21053/m.45696 type:complete len:570 (-) Transcript_21053:422-2131(-)